MAVTCLVLLHEQDQSDLQLERHVPSQRIPSSKAGQVSRMNEWVFKAWLLRLQLETSSWGSCLGL